MKILIVNTANCYMALEEDVYKSKLQDFKFEEVKDDSGNVNCYIEINSIEDLAKLYEAVGHDLILHFEDDDESFIEIYDDWRE
jgi:hypothetical protein